MDQHTLIQQAFSKQADRFGEKTLTLARQDYLQWMVDHLHVQPNLIVLDVATGTGHLSRALAPQVKHVVAIDATPAMLQQGREEAKRAGLHNLLFLQGFAETLPFADNLFDLVTCRFAMHHFAVPRIQMQEMVRVCRPHGRVAIIDLVAPDDAVLAVQYNRVERLRDPSHTRALTISELKQSMQSMGLQITQITSRAIEVSIEPWLHLTHTDLATSQAIKAELLQEIGGTSVTGMRPFLRDHELLFLQTWVIMIGIKSEHA
jgi:ubiquinone/menaquinone biosynthesis C-methylase UbiE